jgi:hypothetical protein
MTAVPQRRVVMGLIFFPRGGSAQVVRYLARSLPSAGWHPTIACGSLGPSGLQSNAATFFGGLDVRPVDYTAAASAPDPLAADPPFHPSYEDRAGAPDRVFGRVDDEAYERLVSAWIEHLRAAGAGEADLLHLHHLTPLN